MPTRILADGRIVIEVTIKTRNGVGAVIDLVADTGAPYSMIPLATVLALHAQDPLAQISRGRFIHIGNWGGNILEIRGLTLEAAVEDPGGGNSAMRACSTLAAHSIAQPQTFFESALGLLGMNVFDGLAADPVKDRIAMRAYLAKRI